MDWFKESDHCATFNTFSEAIKCFVSIPTTSCSCERAYSKLVNVKTKLRSTMGQERLDALLFLHIEQELCTNVDNNSVIAEFKTLSLSERRLLL